MGEAAQTRTPETQLFHDVFNASPIGIAVENLDGQPLFVNPALCSMLGFSEEEMRSKHCVNFSPPEDAEKDWALFQKLRAGSIDHYQIEKRYFRRDGSLVWGRLSISLLNSRPSPLVIAMVEDITAKRTAEEALRESEACLRLASERLHLAIEAGSAGGWDYDLKTGKNVWFGKAHAQLGMTPDETSGSRKEFWDRVHEDDRKRVEHALQVAKDKREEFVEDLRIVWRDGTTHWLRSRGRYYYATNGEPERMLGISIDITDRKQAEESRLRLATIVESSDDAIISKNLDGVIVSWNAGAQRIYGYTEAEALGKPINTLVPAELLDEQNRILDRLRAGERIEHYETVRITKAGERIDVSLSLSPIKDSSGAITALSGIARDITERKLAQETLRETNRALGKQTALLQSRQELLRVFVKNVPAPVAMFDREMRYLEVSDRWCTTYSVDGSQILGRSHYDAFPDLPERYKEIHRRGLAGETIRADEDRWDREGGTTWSRWEVRPWKTPEGAVGGILIFAEDITRRKQMEEALSHMSRKLIESQEQERARIGRELHDDINQRLAMLAVELEQLQENPSEVQSRVQDLRKQTIELSKDVQALSHDLHSSKLEYLGVVAGIRSWCKEFAERQRMEIAFKSDVSSVLPLEVGLALFRVLQEALNNTIKHSRVKRVEVQIAERSNEVHLLVTDSGKGFDVEAAKQSRGLGLTSMQERVRLVNGTISIESKPMSGTSIHVRVPLTSAEGAEREAV